MGTDLERIKKLEAKVAELSARIFALEGDTRGYQEGVNDALEKRIIELEHNMIFLLELGIEKHLADHNRELHERELSLDFKKDAGLSRAGIDY